MTPNKIYNIQTRAEIKPQGGTIAFCAIGQSEQFYNYVRQFYELKETFTYEDHYKYTPYDISHLAELAKKYNVCNLITTQKDETKILDFVQDFKDVNFNVLELKNEIINI